MATGLPAGLTARCSGLVKIRGRWQGRKCDGGKFLPHWPPLMPSLSQQRLRCVVDNVRKALGPDPLASYVREGTDYLAPINCAARSFSLT